MTQLLEARDLSAVLLGDSGDVSVLDRVSFALDPGEVVDVVGPSGSGKSTLLRALARLLPDVTGSLLLDGSPAETLAPARWRLLVALLPQKPSLVAGTLRDNLTLPWRFAVRRESAPPADDVLAEKLAFLGVDAALERDASRLSVGQAARVAFLRTLLTGPRVLLLDEPDAALDDASAEAMGALIAQFVGAPAVACGGADTAVGRAVVRVRHHGADGLATRRMHLEGGHLAVEPGGAA